MTRRTAQPPPLYDATMEHDACGVGFVADAGGTSGRRVLPLALAGLASLGHRGAFGADGESSDGAGVALPLDGGVVDHLTEGMARRAAIGRRPGVLQLFLPRGRGSRRARAIVTAAIEEVGLTAAAWRAVPSDPSVLGPAAHQARPDFAQVFISRPRSASGRATTDRALDRRLMLARRRIAGMAAAEDLDDLAVASGSCRLIVYKGLVAGGRLADLYPDLASDLSVPFATFHQRYATNTRPSWRLAQPFGHLAHNGEINTVRGNRIEIQGRQADPDRSGLRAAILARGPLVGTAGSDSASLDDAVDLLVASGWTVAAALAALLPEAAALRSDGAPGAMALMRRTAGFLAPWDGPAALVFTDGATVGALLDRNGLRPLAYAVTRDGLVAAASEAGAIPLEVGEVETLSRLGPGEMLVVDPRRHAIQFDPTAKAALMPAGVIHGAPQSLNSDGPDAREDGALEDTGIGLRFLAGLDAERLRIDVRTMALDGHEPLWSMGDDTPTPGLARVDRTAADHLKQAFAQVTNPAIDPERERLVVDLRVHVGRRAPLLSGIPKRARTVRLARPVVADLDAVLEAIHALPGARITRLDAIWAAAEGPAGLARALDRLANRAVVAAKQGALAVLVSDRRFDFDQVPIPSVLAVGAVHSALTGAGLRGRTDIIAEASDVLDVHALAMALSAGARAVHPWLALRLAAEVAGSRGAEEMTRVAAMHNVLEAFERGLRKTLARMGISAVASYIGGSFFETLDFAPEVTQRCFPAAPGWEGRVGFRQLAERQLARRDAARALAAPTSPGPGAAREPRLPDPGLARFRGDGEHHLFAPRIVAAIQKLATASSPDSSSPEPSSRASSAAVPSGVTESSALRSVRGQATGAHSALDRELEAYRAAIARDMPAVVRDRLELRPAAARRAISVGQVETASGIVRRLVVSAMSVGALSPEAHQVLTIGIQRAGGAANTGEGGEDPAWYTPSPDGSRRDAAIKQVASGRFGVTAAYLARADQLEIKIAQGSKPGEGGQLPARKATAYIAALRRGQPGRAYISPPPHHDIYSIEDLAQLVADLRAINPAARIGVKLVASRGVGTVAAGVVKAGADYIHLAGGAGGTGASPLSSIKHVGAPWELGLAEVHQVLLWNGLRDRVALRTDGGLQRGRDLLIAALLGAEEFALGTAALVSIGCDMARQCHLDTCPTGIATQRDDLRAKFTGTPEQVERFALALAEDLRHELAAIGARSVGEIVGEASFVLRPISPRDPGLARVIGAPRWSADSERRSAPARAGAAITRPPSSPLESRLVAALRGHGDVALDGLVISTAERSFGAALTGEVERGTIATPIRIALRGAAGQSFGAFLGRGLHLRLSGMANDYVAKGLSGGTVVVAPHPSGTTPSGTAPSGTAPGSRANRPTLAGNTCLYGATAGRLHVIGRAGMRFAVRNAGADAVVEGIGPHGAEYMTGGTLLVLGSVGANFGAGMTGGRAFVFDPAGVVRGRLDATSVDARRLADGCEPDDVADVGRLLRLHRDAGSELAADLLVDEAATLSSMWLVAPVLDPLVLGTVPIDTRSQPIRPAVAVASAV